MQGPQEPVEPRPAPRSIEIDRILRETWPAISAKSMLQPRHSSFNVPQPKPRTLKQTEGTTARLSTRFILHFSIDGTMTGANASANLYSLLQTCKANGTDDKVYCVYIAPSEALVREHAGLGGFPANKVSAVRAMIDPTTAE
jgi:hypothetical protein